MIDDQIYSSKDVAKRLSIEPVTVRKYSQFLEKHGYIFKKDNKDWRQYTDNDIQNIKYIADMKAMGKSVDEATKHIASLYRANLSIANTDTSLQNPEKKLFEFMSQQQNFNKKIIERLDAQEKQQIERDQNLLAVLREIQDTKKQLAATQQKKWWQFWR